MTTSPYRWHRQTVAETFERICGRNSTTPWVAIGDFLDDWRRSAVEHRRELVVEPIAPTPDLQKWAAFCAAMVEWLCWQDGLPFPEWTKQKSYRLQEPWFLYKGWRLRAWQLMTTPTPFKMRNIFWGRSDARSCLEDVVFLQQVDQPLLIVDGYACFLCLY
jgi:hypothetical protein